MAPDGIDRLLDHPILCAETVSGDPFCPTIRKKETRKQKINQEGVIPGKP